MNIDHTKPLFNLSVARCRAAGARGGRRSAEARRQCRLARLSVPAAISLEPSPETARQAIERIDALCPWLRGIEFRTTRRPAA